MLAGWASALTGGVRLGVRFFPGRVTLALLFGLEGRFTWETLSGLGRVIGRDYVGLGPEMGLRHGVPL
jgi:hypothetical protein